MLGKIKHLLLCFVFLQVGLVFAKNIQATLSREVLPKSSSLFIGDSLICNEAGCYPKVFEARTDWQEIKEGQSLPAGLDIRMNLETGLKEAKLPSREEGKDIETLATTDSALIPVSSEKTDYEFTNDFKTVAEVLDSFHSTKDVEKLENKLDDLMVFAHDYKHGYKIITHEFGLLRNISFNQNLPVSVREMGIRMVASCLRNNPSSVDYVKEHYPEIVHEMFSELDMIIDGSSKTATDTALAKRFLSVLDLVLSKSYHFDKNQMLILKKVYSLNDKQLKIKVLELISKYFAQPQNSLDKRELEESASDVREWAQELQSWIQDDSIDELHTRKFFNSLYNIKKQLGPEIKMDPSFVNWLARQAERRKVNMEDQREDRDVEQDSFDKKLVESRHLVFGNPMAHRIKHFNDEL
ncbi:related to Nucleotide exchange factor SIL1 [Zygosaccharomyces bailii]|nr:related to Nucleotide exchange factor SIL1 [Zygosaccharomyces bailii]